jgi:hypothetical protein
MYTLLEVSACWSAWYILFVFPYYDCHVFSVILYEFQCLSQILRHMCFTWFDIMTDIYCLGVYSWNKCEDQKRLTVCVVYSTFLICRLYPVTVPCVAVNEGGANFLSLPKYTHTHTHTPHTHTHIDTYSHTHTVYNSIVKMTRQHLDHLIYSHVLCTSFKIMKFFSLLSVTICDSTNIFFEGDSKFKKAH